MIIEFDEFTAALDMLIREGCSQCIFARSSDFGAPMVSYHCTRGQITGRSNTPGNPHSSWTGSRGQGVKYPRILHQLETCNRFEPGEPRGP